MRFLLDTDHISILQRQAGADYAKLARRITQVPRDDLVLCVVSFHEQTLGCNTYITRAKTSVDVVRGYRIFDRVLATFASAPVLTFDDSAALVFDDLKRQRLKIATMDLRIAAIAISRALTLLTRNTQDFARVPGLLIEDWTF